MPSTTPVLDPPEAESRSVFIIDDHPVMRLGLKTLITRRSNFTVCGETGQARGALEAVEERRPDILLLDLNLPDGSGFSLLKEMRQAGIRTPVLVISMHPEEAFAERVLRAGANGYLHKGSLSNQVVEAMQTILDGEIFVSPEFGRELIRLLSLGKSRDPDAAVGLLSDREFEVFELIGEGLPPREIAKRLGVSTKTVEAHRGNIRNKLELASGSELIRYAIQWCSHRS